MNLKTVSAALAAAVLAVGMTACHRDNAGAGSSADQYGKRSGSAASGSSSSSPSSPSSMGSSSSRQAAPGGASGSSK
jgi:hypothetical protein